MKPENRQSSIQLIILIGLLLGPSFASAWPGAPAAHEVAPSPYKPLPPSTCSSVVRGEVSTGASKGVSSISISSVPPKVHGGNYVERMSDVRNYSYSRANRLAGAIEVGVLITLTPEENALIVETISDDRVWIRCRGLLGMMRYFKQERRGDGIFLVEIPYAEMPYVQKDQEPSSVLPPEPPRKFDYKKLDSPEFAQQLAATQDLASPSSSPASAEEKLRRLKSITAGNRMMLSLLQKGHEVRLADIETLNATLQEGTEVGRVSTDRGLLSLKLFAGVTRGMDPQIRTINGKNYRIDLKRVQMKAGDGAHFVPASEVPERMEYFLIELNIIDHNTNLFDVIRLYRDFLIAHPFVDGNGRVARVLLDYMLIKAGFSPAPHNVNVTRDILYYTNAETYESFLRAFAEVKESSRP